MSDLSGNEDLKKIAADLVGDDRPKLLTPTDFTHINGGAGEDRIQERGVENLGPVS